MVERNLVVESQEMTGRGRGVGVSRGGRGRGIPMPHLLLRQPSESRGRGRGVPMPHLVIGGGPVPPGDQAS